MALASGIPLVAFSRLTSFILSIVYWVFSVKKLNIETVVWFFSFILFLW
jgi:hypothetical protein